MTFLTIFCKFSILFAYIYSLKMYKTRPLSFYQKSVLSSFIAFLINFAAKFSVLNLIIYEQIKNKGVCKSRKSSW